MEVQEHQDLHNPMYEVRRNLKNTHLPEEEWMNQHYYGLRQNPRKKSFGLESPESMKKIQFRCEECGKGFRYEKCLLNHQEVTHSSTKQRVYEEEEEEEELMKSLCRSFSLVKKKKRTRVTRYRKTPLSFSFTTFLEPPSGFAANDEELEAAESLILLSRSSPKSDDGLNLVAEATDANSDTLSGSYDSGCLRNKKPRKACEFESGFFSNAQEFDAERVSRYETLKQQAREFELDNGHLRKPAEFKFGCLSDEQTLLNEGMTTDEAFKGPACFLGDKCEVDQWKLRKGGELDTAFSSNEQRLVEETCNEPASVLGEPKERRTMSLECLGYLSTEFGVGAMECSGSDTEFYTESNKENYEHQCKLCNKIFSSYQALGGHQTFHRLRQSKNTKHCGYEDDSVTVTGKKKRPTCSICSRRFRSLYALGGHKKSHSKRQHSKTEENHQFLISL